MVRHLSPPVILLFVACGGSGGSPPPPTARFTFDITNAIVAVPQGGSTVAPVRLTRWTGFDGPVTIAATGPAGLTADKLTIAARETAGTLVLHAAASVALAPASLNLVATDSDGASLSGTLRVAVIKPGLIDPAFAGGAGLSQVMSTHAVGFRTNVPLVLMEQPDGKLVVAGTSYDFFAGPAVLIRLLDDGRVDAAFGAGGMVQLPGVGGEAHAVAIQADGKYVVGGSVHKPGETGAFVEGAVWRVNADGTMDAGFGAGGVATFFVPQNAAAATAIQLDVDGHVRVAGTANYPHADVFTARLDSAGQLDQAYGSGGLASHSLSQSAASDPIAADDGGWWIPGTSVDGDHRHPIVVRLDATGALVSDFGTDGVATMAPELAGYDRFLPVPGGFVAVGVSSQGTESATLVSRFDADGRLDEGFGDHGHMLLPRVFAPGMAVLGDGRLLGGYVLLDGSRWDVGLARLSSAGALDPTFGDAGDFRISWFGVDVDPNTTVLLWARSDDSVVVCFDNPATLSWNVFHLN